MHGVNANQNHLSTSLTSLNIHTSPAIDFVWTMNRKTKVGLELAIPAHIPPLWQLICSPETEHNVSLYVMMIRYAHKFTLMIRKSHWIVYNLISLHKLIKQTILQVIKKLIDIFRWKLSRTEHLLLWQVSVVFLRQQEPFDEFLHVQICINKFALTYIIVYCTRDCILLALGKWKHKD